MQNRKSGDWLGQSRLTRDCPADGVASPTALLHRAYDRTRQSAQAPRSRGHWQFRSLSSPCRRPKRAHAHDFDHVDYAEDEYDARIGTTGLHRVAAKVQYVERQTILPPDIVRRVENDSFWSDSKRNLRAVRVV